jgi:hypothetical protein
LRRLARLLRLQSGTSPLTEAGSVRILADSRVRKDGRLFEVIEVFYNELRYHSSLGYLTPPEHEGVKNPERAAA